MINDGRVAGSDPMRANVPRTSTSIALAETVHGEHAPAAQQWAMNMRTIMVDLAVDGDVLYGRPRSAVGFVKRLDGAALAEWATAEVPPWQRATMTAVDWDRAAELLRDWVRDRDRAEVTATPADARRHAEVVAERRRADRRAELERQQAETAAELAAIDSGDPLPTETAPRPGGWLKRRPTPP